MGQTSTLLRLVMIAPKLHHLSLAFLILVMLRLEVADRVEVPCRMWRIVTQQARMQVLTQVKGGLSHQAPKSHHLSLAFLTLLMLCLEEEDRVRVPCRMWRIVTQQAQVQVLTQVKGGLPRQALECKEGGCYCLYSQWYLICAGSLNPQLLHAVLVSLFCTVAQMLRDVLFSCLSLASSHFSSFEMVHLQHIFHVAPS